MTETIYPSDWDCVWVACDEHGHVGAFITAGRGPIPVVAFNHPAIAFDDIERAICELSELSDNRLLVDLPRPDDFITFSRRGLFVYDWQDIHRGIREFTNAYEPVAIPLSPIKVAALPSPLMLLASAVQLRASAFIEGNPIDARLELPCFEGGRS